MRKIKPGLACCVAILAAGCAGTPPTHETVPYLVAKTPTEPDENYAGTRKRVIDGQTYVCEQRNYGTAEVRQMREACYTPEAYRVVGRRGGVVTCTGGGTDGYYPLCK